MFVLFTCLFVCLLLLVEWMAWCGLLIDTKNLEVRSDYSRYANKSELSHISIPHISIPSCGCYVYPLL